MDHDKLVNELHRLQQILNVTDPTDENYAVVEERLIKLAKLNIEIDETCDKQLERQDKLELEREKLMKELEFKVKELELKNELEMKKLIDNSKEAAARRRAEKRQALWDIIKILLQIAGTGALILVTGKIEQSVILGQHKWSLINRAIKT